jgi:hypothetical protein
VRTDRDFVYEPLPEMEQFSPQMLIFINQ